LNHIAETAQVHQSKKQNGKKESQEEGSQEEGC
jgi:hypothetical protein